MKIRSITCFINPGWPLNDAIIQRSGRFIQSARSAYQAAGYEVQTTRLVTVPFPLLIPALDLEQLTDLARSLSQAARDLGFDYVALGPALPDFPASYARVPDLLAAADNLFLAGMMTTRRAPSAPASISMSAIHSCSEIIHTAAQITPDGFTNLRFGAIANVPPGGPFLPAAYADPASTANDAPTFALATEAADLAVQCVSQAESLAGARLALIQTVESHARSLVKVAETLAAAHAPLRFGGIDFTLAPFPRAECSFGAALERLGVPAVGLHGSLAAAAILTDTLDQARYPRAGFNGLMLPVLEDAILARRAAEGRLNLVDLLLYSSVCGTGLDTIPLPGDVSAQQLAAVLLDVAALALRLDKPLIARLMPIPGKTPGDLIEFDFPFFASSRVLPLAAEPLSGFLAGSAEFSLAPRQSWQA